MSDHPEVNATHAMYLYRIFAGTHRYKQGTVASYRGASAPRWDVVRSVEKSFGRFVNGGRPPRAVFCVMVNLGYLTVDSDGRYELTEVGARIGFEEKDKRDRAAKAIRDDREARSEAYQKQRDTAGAIWRKEFKAYLDELLAVGGLDLIAERLTDEGVGPQASLPWGWYPGHEESLQSYVIRRGEEQAIQDLERAKIFGKT